MEMLSLKSYCVFTPAVFSLMNSMNALSDVLTHCFSKWNPSEHFLIPTKWRRRHRSICSSWATSCVKSQTFTLRLRFMLSRELGRLSTLCLRREAVVGIGWREDEGEWRDFELSNVKVASIVRAPKKWGSPVATSPDCSARANELSTYAAWRSNEGSSGEAGGELRQAAPERFHNIVFIPKLSNKFKVELIAFENNMQFWL